MAEKQGALVAALPTFVDRLERSFDGLPSLHIGVISTDVGVEGIEIQGCSTSGDDGILQRTPRIGGCRPPTDPYISDVVLADGARSRNYTGDLANEIACIVPLGVGGCQIEQPLEAIRRALDGRHAANIGFLRDDARLAVVLITDEDDCSLSDPTILGEHTPPTSFSCFQHGVRCEPDDATTRGEKSGCVPRADSSYLGDVGMYVAFLSGLKADPADITVVEIAGNPDPVVVGDSLLGAPQLQSSCRGELGDAVPAIRLRSFVNAFGGGAASICASDFDAALTEVISTLCDCSVSTQDESFYACDAGPGAGGTLILLSIVFTRRRGRRRQ
jgi:hypothetical protein